LKLLIRGVQLVGEAVAPLAGAGIEIIFSSVNLCLTPVAPLAGAGIEISVMI